MRFTLNSSSQARAQLAGERLRDYLSEREQYTVINGVTSENTKVAHGRPQGSVLGPIPFALYTSDLPKAVNNEWRSCMLLILPCTVLVNP